MTNRGRRWTLSSICCRTWSLRNCPHCNAIRPSSSKPKSQKTFAYHCCCNGLFVWIEYCCCYCLFLFGNALFANLIFMRKGGTMFVVEMTEALAWGFGGWWRLFEAVRKRTKDLARISSKKQVLGIVPHIT